MVDPALRLTLVERQIGSLSRQIDVCEIERLPHLFVTLDKLRLEVEILTQLNEIRTSGFTTVRYDGEEATISSHKIKYHDKKVSNRFFKYCNNIKEMAFSLGY